MDGELSSERKILNKLHLRFAVYYLHPVVAVYERYISYCSMELLKYGGVFFMSFFNLDSKDQYDSRSTLKGTKLIAIGGLLIALYIIMSYMNIAITQVIQIRFGFVVLAIAGLCGGPIMGATVGAVGDILSTIITGGQGASFFFGFTCSYALIGLCFGFIFYKSKVTIPRAILAAIVEFLNAMFLNTLWLSMLYGLPYKAQFITRLPKNIIMLGINIVIVYIVLKSLSVALRKAQIIV